MSEAQASRAAGRRILFYYLAAFAIVLSVNAYMAYKAISTRTGEVTDNAYQRGLAYNQTLDEAAAEDALGWMPTVTLGHGSVSIRVTDKAGAPIAFDTLEGTLFRPVNAGDDQNLRFTRTAAGAYVAAVSLPHDGLWEVHALGRAGSKKLHINKRIVVH